MLILGIDFETTGLLKDKDYVTEIGAVVWDAKEKIPVDMVSYIIKDENIDISKEITQLTGLTNYVCDTYGMSGKEAFENLNAIIDECDYIMAHNAPFDKGFYEASCERYGLEIADKVWVCSKEDISYPDNFKSKALNSLAMEYHLVNPFAHRAVTDVLTMFRVMEETILRNSLQDERVKELLKELRAEEFEEIKKHGTAEKVHVRARVSFQEKEFAKKRSYRWFGESKMWCKTIKDFQLDQEIADAPFEVIVLKELPNG